MNRRTGSLAVLGAVAVLGLVHGAVRLTSPATPGTIARWGARVIGMECGARASSAVPPCGRRPSGPGSPTAGTCSYAVSLITTTCPGCGKVKVYVDSQLWGTFDLSSPTKVDRKLIQIAAEPEDGGLRGPLELKVVSRAKPVIIDGLVLSVW